MKSKKSLQVFAAMALVGTLGVFGLASCSSGDGAGAGSTGGVAATVNGTEIAEDTVTNYIQAFRVAQGAEDEEGWGTWLSTYGLTPESVREEVINYYANQILIEQAAEEQGVTVTDEEVDEQVNSMKERYADDDAWKDALSQAGTTEEDYRTSVRSSMLEAALEEKITSETDNKVNDEELLEQVKMYADYFSGAKKSSHILFNTDDTETAQKVLDQINNGEISFEDAASQYSQDSGSAANGGDVGWDLLNSFVTEYTDGLAELEVDQVSGLITSEFGIHIIKCTEVYNAPEEVTSLDQVPAELVEYIREMADSSKASENYNNWFTEYRDKAEIVINPMPEGLPYIIDMTPYQSSSQASSDSAAVEVTTEEGSSDSATVEVTTEEGAEATAEASSTEEAAVEATSSAQDEAA